ncbi:M16 family metallopeptidase [Paenibacillus xylanexedens]|uniref:Zn-dependent peptidase n=1 Tax=Paenibacillus xylanexedens TaxID=528191 RepID=A0ABS4RY08_PAEXY|nr:pitrilysin family protein [Paenibacillus xylanexedens]MBP2247765.1 putative Zn-dependent peptidase [Paenibacillus xylanexedens]
MNSIVNIAPVRRRLSNGLSVHIFPEPQFHHTFVSWSVSYGSIHDAALPGRAHFLEHMMFYNPDQRPVKPLFHTMGASTSALTRYDVTTYQMACTGDLKRSLALFSGMLAAPYFTPMHMEQERSAIHQELSMYADQPSWRALQQLTQMMYGSNHPITMDVAGTPDSIYQMTTDELNHAYNTRYVTGRMAVAVAGPFEAEFIVDMLEKFPAMEPLNGAYLPEVTLHYLGEDSNKQYREIECGLSLPLVRYGFRAEDGMQLKEQVACMIGIEALLGETSDFYAECMELGLLHKGAEWDHYYRKEFAFSNACGYSADPVSLYNRVEEMCEHIQNGTLSLSNLNYARMKWLSKHYSDMDSLKQRCMHVSEYEVIGLDYMQLSKYALELTEEEVRSGLRTIATSARLRMVVIR